MTLDTAAPNAPVLLGIDPDTRAVQDDLRTNTLTFSVFGVVAEAGLVITIDDLTSGDPLDSPLAVGTDFQQTVTVNSPCTHLLRVTATDTAGNVSEESVLEVLVDLTRPQVVSVEKIRQQSIAIPISEVTVTFTEALEPGTFDIDDFTVTRNDTIIDLTGVTVAEDSPLVYRITGLASATSENGTYRLSIHLSGLMDQAGNAGQGMHMEKWSKVDATASIGDFIWLDLDQDGLQDANEIGLANVTVHLYLEDGTAVDSTQTDGDGGYGFTGLNPGQRYYLEIPAPAGYAFTYSNRGADDFDSDWDLNAGHTRVFDVALGNNDTWDAGLVKLGSISGVVWHDTNRDGERQDAEPLLAGWAVYLDANSNGNSDAGETTAQTGANGTYTFSNLRAGSYVVALLLEEDWQQTHPGIDGLVLEITGAEIVDASMPLPASHGFPASVLEGPHAARELIGQDDLLADERFAHLDGSGQAVVIIDTGVDLDHGYFGQDVDGDNVADRIVYQYDFADNDSDASDYRGHGTHVAGIIGSSDETLPGLAPHADLVILKVFSDNNTGQFSDVERALQWVIANASLYNITAVNMSFGDGQNWGWLTATDCGCGNTVQRQTYGLVDELASLSTMGVIVAAPVGNSFYEFNSEVGMNYPAADPATISVGAVWDSDRGGSWTFSSSDATDYTTDVDRIVAFSQRQPEYLDTFAPGAIITSSGLNGSTVRMQGTSQATAIVTGVVALAQQLAYEHLGRALTLYEFRTLLQSAGDVIFDGDDEHDNVINTGQAFTRVNVYNLA